jgi:hypothetical protein
MEKKVQIFRAASTKVDYCHGDFVSFPSFVVFDMHDSYPLSEPFLILFLFLAE